MKLQVNDSGYVWVNQAEREYDCIAIHGDQALIVYTMPAGREFAVEVSAVGDEIGPQVSWRNISRNKPPARWREAIENRYPIRANCSTCKGEGHYRENGRWHRCDNCRN